MDKSLENLHLVASAADVAAVLAEVREGATVVLGSPPDIGPALGPAVFAAMIADGRAARPDVTVVAAMDCGDLAGRALAALAAGLSVRLDPTCPAYDRVAAIAGQRGLKVWPSWAAAVAGN